jgi:hypothetical protein
MTDTSNPPVICGHCGTTGTRRRGSHPWCEPCEIWLVPDPTTGEWVGFAERDHRSRTAENAVAIVASAQVVAETVLQLAALVPAGWNISANQNLPGAVHTIALAPPPATLEVTAYLIPPDQEHGWHVRVHNQTQRMDYPLFESGGVRAASYTTAEAALRAAINAVRIDLT